MAPNIDISVTSGAEALDSMDLGRDDIEGEVTYLRNMLY